MVVLGSIDGIPPHEKTLEFVAADDNPASWEAEFLIDDLIEVNGIV